MKMYQIFLRSSCRDNRHRLFDYSYIIEILLKEKIKSLHNYILGLKFLVRICSDLGLKEAQEYATKLKKAEKAKELKDQRASSGTRRGSGRRRDNAEPGMTGGFCCTI